MNNLKLTFQCNAPTANREKMEAVVCQVQHFATVISDYIGPHLKCLI